MINKVKMAEELLSILEKVARTCSDYGISKAVIVSCVGKAIQREEGYSPDCLHPKCFDENGEVVSEYEIESTCGGQDWWTWVKCPDCEREIHTD